MSDAETLLAGRYQLGPLIGRGGMADVHRATDVVLERQVAVKLLRPQASSTAERERFAAEARTVGGLTHPAIVSLLDAGLDPADGDRPFLVLELVEGPSLATRIAEGPLPPQEVQRIGAQLAAALAHAHAHGVVHRDVKPGNVLLGPDGRVRLTDFGIARAVGAAGETVTGTVLGSPAYVAPEQVAAEQVGPPADVYALGLVLLEALTGQRPFRGTGVEVAYARLHAAPELPVSLGPLWVGALGSMTARRPEDRPPADGVARLLTSPPAYDPVATAAFASGPSSAPHLRPGLAGRMAAGLAGLAALALLGVVSLGTPVTDPAGAGPTPPTSNPSAHRSPSPTPAPTPSERVSASPSPTSTHVRRHRTAAAPRPRPVAHHVGKGHPKKHHGKGHHQH